MLPFCKKTIDINEIEDRIKFINDKIEKYEQRASEGSEDNDKLKDKFTRVVFVVLKTPEDTMKVINAQNGFFYNKIKSFFGCFCCLDNDQYWMFERAPEPSDIFWENIGTSTI
jgi:hypothetical protein